MPLISYVSSKSKADIQEVSGATMSAATPLIPFEGGSAPSAGQIANDHSLFKIDQELDFLLEQIEDEIEEKGEARKESVDRLQAFAEAMNIKVDRIGRYLAVMEARAVHCKKEAVRYTARAKRAESKIERTKQMVLYYLESHDLKKIESHEFTLKRNKNSQDSVVITQPDSIPDDLRRFEAKVDGPLWLEVIDALPKTLAEPLAASVKSTQPSNSAIQQHIANGGVVDGVSVKHGYHLRIE
jgi:hypothetical protein